MEANLLNDTEVSTMAISYIWFRDFFIFENIVVITMRIIDSLIFLVGKGGI